MAKKSPSNSSEHSASQRIVKTALIAIVVAPFIVFPPVRFPSKNTTAATAQQEAFSAQKFAAKLWAEKLLPSTKTAVDARILYAALETKPDDAAKKYGRVVGIGGTSYYFVAGDGIVSAVDGDGVTLSLADGTRNTLVLDTGLVFGNAVRDGTGLLDINTFANSEEFNAIASELNAIVEKDVIPTVQKLGTVGAKLSFAGIAELTNTDGDPRPLHLIPLKIEAKP